MIALVHPFEHWHSALASAFAFPPEIVPSRLRCRLGDGQHCTVIVPHIPSTVEVLPQLP